MKRPFPSIAHPFCGYTLIEVLVSVALLATGIVAIAMFFPKALEKNQRAADRSTAAFLAQMKAEEIRRDEFADGRFIQEIQETDETNASEPVPFGVDERFAYRLSGLSLLDPDPESSDPLTTHGIARVVIQYAPDYKPDDEAEILYELRFDY